MCQRGEDNWDLIPSICSALELMSVSECMQSACLHLEPTRLSLDSLDWSCRQAASLGWRRHIYGVQGVGKAYHLK